MQSSSPPSSPQLNDSARDLVFPVIATYDSLDSLLNRSHLVDTPESGSPANMASQPDDVSVDGSVSSITESQWDVVDEASAASEDEASGISRQPTPYSDPPEHLTLDTASLTGNDTSSESQGLRSPRHFTEFNRLRKDSNSDPPHTARRTVPLQSLAADAPDFDFCREDQEHHIRFAENGPSQDTSLQEVSFHLTDLEGRERKEILANFGLHDSVHLRGTLRQSMSQEILRLAGPFKILYHGQGPAKAAIVEKIGTALAAHLSASTTNVMDSSRVTVVPVSTITENNAPDVVLIDSMGLDMNIEECTFASSPRGGAFGGTMSLTINNQKSVESSWNPASRRYEASGGYQLPHLALFYVPEDETPNAEQTRSRAQSFLARHRVPVIIISSTPEWTKKGHPIPFDLRTPHLCLEYVDMAEKEIKLLRRMPIDLNTFLSIDAGQMNRNLARLTKLDAVDAQNTRKDVEAQQPGLHGHHRSVNGAIQGKAAIPIRKLPVLLLSVAWDLFIFCLLHMYRGGLLSDHTASPAMPRPTAKSVMKTPFPPNVVSITHRPSNNLQPESAKRPANSISQASSSELVALLMETSSTPNKSEKFKAQIVGDSHIVLRPPGWFNAMRKPPILHFKVRRDQKEIPFEFSTLFDGVFALKLPQEDAHGVLDISMWTIRRPQVNESFRVDFGSPWLKVQGWWQSARVMTDSVKGEFGAAQKRVFKAYQLANKHLENAEQTFKEVEKASLGSLRLTSKTAQLLMENSRQLSRGLSKRLSAKMHAQQRKLHNDILDLSKVVSAALYEQIGQMRGAAAGLDMLALRHKIRSYREQNFRQAQIKMLHTWWKIRGSPSSSGPALPKVRKTRRCKNAGVKTGRPFRR